MAKPLSNFSYIRTLFIWRYRFFFVPLHRKKGKIQEWTISKPHLNWDRNL